MDLDAMKEDHHAFDLSHGGPSSVKEVKAIGHFDALLVLDNSLSLH
jgi:hypothetical protein